MLLMLGCLDDKKFRQNFAVAQMAQNQSEDNVDILCWYDFEYDKNRRWPF